MTDYLQKLKDKWEVIDETRLRRTVEFPTFAEAIAFVNKVAAIAEAQQHHPDIHILYSEVIIVTWTHDVNALTEKDFTLANAIEDSIGEYL